MPGTSIESVFEKNKKNLLTIDGVVGVAIGKCQGESCIRVFVKTEADRCNPRIPRNLEGYKVMIDKTDEFRAL